VIKLPQPAAVFVTIYIGKTPRRFSTKTNEKGEHHDDPIVLTAGPGSARPLGTGAGLAGTTAFCPPLAASGAGSRPPLSGAAVINNEKTPPALPATGAGGGVLFYGCTRLRAGSHFQNCHHSVRTGRFGSGSTSITYFS